MYPDMVDCILVMRYFVLQSAHNQETGCQESLTGFSVHLVCHDVRSVKLLFVPHKKAVHAAMEIQADKTGRHRLLKALTSALKPIARSSSSGGIKVSAVIYLLMDNDLV